LKIYIVSGTTGEYSDRSGWLVRAVKTEKQAQTLVELCTSYARENGCDRGQDNVDWDDRDRVKAENPYDKNMQIDYTGIRYYYEPVEFGPIKRCIN